MQADLVRGPSRRQSSGGRCAKREWGPCKSCSPPLGSSHAPRCARDHLAAAPAPRTRIHPPAAKPRTCRPRGFPRREEAGWGELGVAFRERRAPLGAGTPTQAPAPAADWLQRLSGISQRLRPARPLLLSSWALGLHPLAREPLGRRRSSAVRTTGERKAEAGRARPPPSAPGLPEPVRSPEGGAAAGTPRPRSGAEDARDLRGRPPPPPRRGPAPGRGLRGRHGGAALLTAAAPPRFPLACPRRPSRGC